MKPNSITQKCFVKNHNNELFCGFNKLSYGIEEPIWAEFGQVVAMSYDTANLVAEKINQQTGKLSAFVVILN